MVTRKFRRALARGFVCPQVAAHKREYLVRRGLVHPAPSPAPIAAAAPVQGAIWDVFHGDKWLATRRALTGDLAIAALRVEFATRTDVKLPQELTARPGFLQEGSL